MIKSSEKEEKENSKIYLCQ